MKQRSGATSGRRFDARTLRVTLPAAILAGLLTACGDRGDQEETPVATSPPATASPVPTAVAVALSEVVWARRVDATTGGPVDEVDSFTSADKAIYALVHLTRCPAGMTVTATWSYNDTPITGAQTIVTPEASSKPIWLEFHLTWRAQGAWPPGRYQIVLEAEGIEPVRGEIELVQV